jgi:hypothetical protein
VETPTTRDPTQFLNVDLEVRSLSPLGGMVQALGDDAFVLHVGRVGRQYAAYLELAGSSMSMSADLTIRRLVRLVEALPSRHRQAWNGAVRRDFNIGIEAGLEPRSFALRLRPDTVESVVRVGGAIVVTVYAPDPATFDRLPALAHPPGAKAKGGRRARRAR